MKTSILNNLHGITSETTEAYMVISTMGNSEKSIIRKNLSYYLDENIDPNLILLYLTDGMISSEELSLFLSHGAAPDECCRKLSSADVADNIDILISYGANINKCVANMDSNDICNNIEKLLKYNVNPYLAKLRMNDSDVAECRSKGFIE